VSFQLRVSAHPTDVTGFGLLPTVKTTDSHKQRSLDENGENTSHTTGTKYGLHLTQLAEAGMLGTPTSRLHARSERFAEGRTMNPQEFANAMLPTPTATSDPKGGCTRPDPSRQRDTLAHALHDPTLGKTSQLNPRFVAEMMGFPVNWTELPFQSGEPNQSKPTETP
jgi:hypothetical protein